MIRIKGQNKTKYKSSAGEDRPLPLKEINDSLLSLEDWCYVPEKSSIRAEYKTGNFLSAAYFILEVAKLAETMGHHPDVHLTGYKYLSLDLTTHAVNGVTINDFVLAKEISEKFAEYPRPSKNYHTSKMRYLIMKSANRPRPVIGR